ncbi:MAG: flagellar hook protein FlgE [Chloroflexota bacterium]|nr:MAG: flagellar hook protein FlgE [Chloroflexota bacterium]
MLRSLFSAVSGLHEHQTFMDVIGNNLANVNTTAFRAGRVTFKDVLSETIKSASPGQGARGATNPQQIGLGMLLSGIDTIQTQGSLQATGKYTDMAIQGDGFFLLSDGTGTYYSRDGSFDIGINGTLVNPGNGMKVYGWMADNTGAIDTTQPTAPLVIPLGQDMVATASSRAALRGNLSSQATDPYTIKLNVFDAQGGSHDVDLTFTKTGDNAWTWTAATTDATVTDITLPADLALAFDPSTGKLTSPTTSPQITLQFAGGVADADVTLDFSAVTQLNSASGLTPTSNGNAPGNMTSFAVDDTGQIFGVYSNGLREALGQLALANFANPGGLLRSGGNMYQVSSSSGDAMVGTPATGGRGTVNTGFLEASNVDLAQQFTDMIRAQRGFQANSRVITTSDDMLQELVNLKR